MTEWKRKAVWLILLTLLATAFSGALADKDQPSLLDIACEPTDIIRAADGSFLVTDAYYKVVLRVKDGTTDLYAGRTTREGLYGEPIGGYYDTESTNSTFRKPWAITTFNKGYAVTDTNNNCVRYVTEYTTQTITGDGQEGDTIGSALNTEWCRPTGLTTDENGDLYVSDTGNNRVCRIDHKTGNVTAICTDLNEPSGLCWHDGCLYIAETAGNRILKWDRETGDITALAGNGEAAYLDGAAEEAAFAWPLGVEVGDDGAIFIADSGNCAIRMLKDGVVTTLMIADMEALDQYPSHPQGMLYEDGLLYVCDPYANKVYTVTMEEP